MASLKYLDPQSGTYKDIYGLPGPAGPTGPAGPMVSGGSDGQVLTRTFDIVATNQAVNPGLEGGSLTGWESTNAKWPLAASTTSPISGSYSALATRNTATDTPGSVCSIYPGNVGAGAHPAMPVTPGVPITFSLDVKTERADREIRRPSATSPRVAGLTGTPAQ